jgi:hypothetical protein
MCARQLKYYAINDLKWLENDLIMALKNDKFLSSFELNFN